MKNTKHLKSCWISNSATKSQPWGDERAWSALDNIRGKILSIRQGARTSFKYNTLKDECLFVLAGSIEVEYGSEASIEDAVQYPLQKRVLKHGDCLNIQSCCPYRIMAIKEAKVIEISAQRHNNKSVRIEDDYGRN